MHAKQKFFIITAVFTAILLVGLGVIFYVYSQNQDKIIKPAANTNKNSSIINNNKININSSDLNNINAINSNENINSSIAAPVNANDAEEKKNILSLAKNFTERFGTYSNQNESSNLVALKSLMTPDMQVWADKLIAANKEKPNDLYYSVITTATTIELTQYDAANNTANVVVGTIKQETKGLPVKKNEYQEKLEIELKKVDGFWKINSAYWHSN